MSNEKPKLSRRQKTILDFIRQTILDRGWPPSIREIGEAVGLSSSSTVHSHLKSLENKGYLRRNPSTPRSIILLEPKPSPTAAEERVTELEERLKLAESQNAHLESLVVEVVQRSKRGEEGLCWGELWFHLCNAAERAEALQPTPAGELAEREAA